eukprot:NODE_4818_length_550_cov_303.662675_g3526_i0.p4 GENE.NODE_4818_length_550_cov_303.662675_g3526_i0~~NODE_4818_length_550_cov_303.662675_g3526_i0.p4  ORF type:complete len:62 (+),score=0.25 NODE_4818_length_550_cov_303.662675_g3526_i0:235-420(+)
MHLMSSRGSKLEQKTLVRDEILRPRQLDEKGGVSEQMRALFFSFFFVRTPEPPPPGGKCHF